MALLGAAGGLLVLLDHPGGTELLDDVGVSDTAVGSGSTATTPTTSAPTTSEVPSAGGSTSSSTTSTVPAAPTCTASTTITGDTVSTRYGTMQVEAAVAADGTICSVEALEVPSNDRRSVAINQQAVPTLTQRAVAAGDADFNGVSGATITSNAYKTSLQSILDQL